MDYMSHIGRGFMVAEGLSAEEKVQNTLGSVGVAMTNAFMTSILGVVMLSQGASLAKRTFFKAMFVVFVCSYIFGVFFFPSILSLTDSWLIDKHSKEEKNAKEKVAKSHETSVKSKHVNRAVKNSQDVPRIALQSSQKEFKTETR